jgi:hypothetical protein
MLVKIKKADSETVKSFLASQTDIRRHFNVNKLITYADKKKAVYYVITTGSNSDSLDSEIVATLAFHKLNETNGHVNFVYIAQKFRGLGLMYLVAGLVFKLPFLHYPEIKSIKWYCLRKERVALNFYNKIAKDTGDPSTSLIKKPFLFKVVFAIGKNYSRDGKPWTFLTTNVLKEVYDNKQIQYDISSLIKPRNST